MKTTNEKKERKEKKKWNEEEMEKDSERVEERQPRTLTCRHRHYDGIDRSPNAAMRRCHPNGQQPLRPNPASAARGRMARFSRHVPAPCVRSLVVEDTQPPRTVVANAKTTWRSTNAPPPFPRAGKRQINFTHVNVNTKTIRRRSA
ncbi:hypothetical protein QLX08_009778 [Tetragonisca angustula]|uniref:Uncharacterized protein n=1 Tax=Tetragonisca angustula TaxID=166442 RepID=A0AAW0ZEQ9_9HYME